MRIEDIVGQCHKELDRFAKFDARRDSESLLQRIKQVTNQIDSRMELLKKASVMLSELTDILEDAKRPDEK